MKTEHFEIGQSMAEMLHDAAPGSVKVAGGTVQALEESPAVMQSLCKMAADMYQACGKDGTAEFFLYSKLASADVLPDTLREFGAPVLEVLGEMLVKEAAGPQQMVATLLGGAAGLVPSALATLAGASVGAGAAAGATTWALNRGATSDSMEMENLKRRIHQYDVATAELTRRLERQGKLPRKGVEEDEEFGQ